MSSLKKDKNNLEIICSKRKAKCEKMIKKIEKIIGELQDTHKRPELSCANEAETSKRQTPRTSENLREPPRTSENLREPPRTSENLREPHREPPIDESVPVKP
jgi:hypothetical protein